MGTGLFGRGQNDEKAIIDLFGELGERLLSWGMYKQTNGNEKVRLCKVIFQRTSVAIRVFLQKFWHKRHYQCLKFIKKIRICG
jgi:hypothetical protein